MQAKKGSAMTAKHRITVNLDDTEYKALQRIAFNTDRSLAWLGRRAICDFIEQRERANTLSPARSAGTKTRVRQPTT